MTLTGWNLKGGRVADQFRWGNCVVILSLNPDRPVASYVSPDLKSEEMVDRLLHFGTGLCSAASAGFFWIGNNYEIIELKTVNIKPCSIRRYISYGEKKDPINIKKLSESRKNIATLRNALAGDERRSEYLVHLQDVNIGDEIDLLFWYEKNPIACLSLFRPIGESDFCVEMFDWEGFRTYLESTLSLHWRIRSINVENKLVHKYRLQPRELQVVELLTMGAGNQQISDALNISLSTVKTHIVSILDKTGADSRLGVASIVSQLQYSS
ncbi:MAG: LuxR C-terminal-related transcriptional regulator [Sphingomonadaceae bacterium]